MVLSAYANNITISIRGKDESTCTSSANGTTQCKTLQYVSQQLISEGMNQSISIHVSDETMVRDLVNFEDIHGLAIIGGTIKCNKNGRNYKGGIIIRNVTNLSIDSVLFSRCGAQINDRTVVLRVIMCINVTIINSHFQQSRETALMIENTFGFVLLANVNFTDNKNYETRNQNFSSPGAIEVILDCDCCLYATVYVFSECLFKKNTSPKHFNHFDSTLPFDSNWRGQSIGGALGMHIRGNWSNSAIEISDCIFEGNIARWGGGLHIMIQDKASNNLITILNSTFDFNRAIVGGGGACIQYFRPEYDYNLSKNEITFENCTFSQNRGDIGGGLALLSIHTHFPISSTFNFIDCKWTDNKALFSSAVLVTPAAADRLSKGYLPSPNFENCSFQNNIVMIHKGGINVSATYFFTYSGVFSITESIVYFSDHTLFYRNNGSALYVASGQVIFKEGSRGEFIENSGLRGAAIAMYGLSSLLLNSNSLVLFSGNQAQELGGGIYYNSYDQEDYISGRNCFMRFENGRSINESLISNLTLIFENNSANVTGTSVYASTLFPCHFDTESTLHRRGLDYSIFDSLGNITLDRSDQRTPTAGEAQYPLATFGRYFNLSKLKLDYQIIPGKLVNVSFNFLDEFHQNNPRLAAFALSVDNRNITLDREYTLQGEFRLFGQPGTKGTLQFSQDLSRTITLNVSITLLQCPPGLFYDREKRICECSGIRNQKRYQGIVKCNNFQAHLLHGYWAGYVPATQQEPEKLFSALCPLEFCMLDSESNSYTTELPLIASELSEAVCGMNRQGILCGQCKQGSSSFFHSKEFRCDSNALCSAGIPFYVLSELIPVVILFSVIIILDFSFTNGHINGFIFLSQVLELLSVDTKIYNNQHSNRLLAISRLFYDIFNLDYFSIYPFSFCLWKDATVIDILAFKYITVIFAFMLIICLILITKYTKCSNIRQKLSMKDRISVINGLSAFLVVCYAQCARTSFYILTSIRLRTQGGIDGDLVTFFGGMPYFQGRHLFYAIVAIFFIIILVFIPPFILFAYPLTLHLLALCNLSEHRFIGKLLTLFQINRLKPLIDNFQGCYKDKLRFFAGLYFIYRVIILGCYSAARSSAQFYILTQFFLMGFMGIHSIAQPYKKRSHNVIDSLIFLALVTINGCTIFINVYAEESRETNTSLGVILTIVIVLRLVLLYIPMICFLMWLIGMVILFLTSKSCNSSVVNLKKKLLLKWMKKDEDPKTEFFISLDDHELQVPSHNETSYDDRTEPLVDSYNLMIN